MAAEPMTKSRASASLGGALRAESSEGVLRVVFSGEWKRDLLGPNFFTERDEALRETLEGTTGLDTAAQAKTVEGFTALPITQVKVASSGETVV